ncbi:MAG: hypothetical protein RJA52_1333, partial [Bacteroidota bacterium]
MKPFCFSILFLIVYDLQGLNDSIWWIPNKEYFKIEIEESSWYRIDNQLIRDFNKVSLFHHGKRQKVYFVEETDSEFYGIYFFGKENSIEFDLKLFQKNRRSLNYKKGLLNKSSPYFLCFEPSLFEEDYFVKIKDPQELPSMFEPRCVNWDNFYFKPRIGPEQLIANSFFDDGEGFGSTPSRNYQFEIFGQETLHFRLANLGKLNNIQIKVDGKTLYRKNGLVPFELIIDSIMLDFPKIYKIEWIADEEVTVGSFCSGRVVIAPGIRDIKKISPSVIPTFPVNPANFIIIASTQFKRDAQVLEQYLQFRNKDFDSAL